MIKHVRLFVTQSVDNSLLVFFQLKLLSGPKLAYLRWQFLISVQAETYVLLVRSPLFAYVFLTSPFG